MDEFVLEEKLDKIRGHASLGLANQKQLAVILSAIDETIDEQHGDKNAVGYFVSFLALLHQLVDELGIVDQQLAAATAYFLDLVFPFTPELLLRAKFGEILIKLAPALTNPEAEAPLVRLTIGALELLLLAQDHAAWLGLGLTLPKRALVGLVEMLFDPRPKVRKRAQDAVFAILLRPPPLPLPVHVGASVACEVALAKLAELLAVQRERKTKETTSQLIHCLQLITQITRANAWPRAHIQLLVDVLLEILRTLDQFLVLAAFAAFAGLFLLMTDAVDLDKLTLSLDVIFELRPQVNDAHLAASWLAVVAKALELYARLLPRGCLDKLPQVMPVVAKYLTLANPDIYLSAGQCLIALVAQSVGDDELLRPALDNQVTPEVYEAVDEFVEYVAAFIGELLSVKYSHATKEVLEFATACLNKFRVRANPDFLPVVEIAGQWRTNELELFAYNKEAEEVLSAAIAQLGPQPVLLVLPLNLTGEHSGPGRAWMLPLLRDHVRGAELGYFVLLILPVVLFFEAKAAELTKHAHIFTTIIAQVWSLLPHFCDLARDVPTLFTGELAGQLTEAMYALVELRQPICHGLRLLVELNAAYVAGAVDDDTMMLQEFPKSQAEALLAHLTAMAANVLLVLFNVFALTSPELRAFVLDTIDVYLQILEPSDLEDTFNTVCGMLKQAMDDADEKLETTMMDLVVAMAKYVPALLYPALFQIFSQTILLALLTVQKRAYRILPRLAETELGQASLVPYLGDIERVLLELAEGAHAAARAARLSAVALVVAQLPADHLWFIPAMLQEVIMSTKDINTRSRGLAYDILIAMGNQMVAHEGTAIDNTKVPGFGADAQPLTALLREYLTMVSAGLAGSNALMILATITALLCLVFEFRAQLDVATLQEIAQTIELFLTHGLREIAKLAIGFVKVEVLLLPEDMVRANLPQILSKLMRWSHEHKGHFKVKVRHILERMVRKFGAEAVEAAIPEEDLKLVANIKKTKARAARKRAAEAEADAAAENLGKNFMLAYDEAVHDLDDDQEDEEKTMRGAKYIVELGDTPLDLLDRQAVAQISLSRPRKQRLAEVRAKALEFKSKNGKLVFEDKKLDPLEGALGIDAYVDAINQAPVRGQRGKLKWRKGHDKEDIDWSDDEKPRKPQAKGARVGKPQKQKFKARKKF